ncbi:MAG: hypothetical protein IPL28_26295 [Chloroflexi bacterium]|nr:hypothetical protein [Chloroflexota bacterium]
MNIVNLTPHALNLINTNGLEVVIAPSGLVARIDTKPALTHTEDGVDFYLTEVTGEPLVAVAGTAETVEFPAPLANTVYAVSGMFRSYFDRQDLYQPAELVRDGAGKIIGAKGLSR